MIPIAKTSLGKEEIEAVKGVFDSCWLGMGSLVFEFEQELKKFLGSNYVIATNTGTSAIHIALEGLGIKEGDEVIVPSLTFCGSVQPILACGARPVFCEIEKDTLCIDTEDVKKRITSKTRAILPVHYGGMPCDLEALMKICGDRRIFLVEDAAHAFGSSYKGKKIGTFGDATCFSFDPIKVITCGEGGAVSVKDKAIAEEITRKRILGIDRDTWHRYQNKRSWFYEVVTKGFRYHMSNINAAIGLVQLKKLDSFIKRRIEVIKRYDEEFREIEGIELLRRDYDNMAPFNYTIKVCADRDHMIDYLSKNGIGTGVQYIPNHTQPLFKERYSALPVTDDLSKRILSLPLYYGITDNEVGNVIDTLKRFFNDEK